MYDRSLLVIAGDHGCSFRLNDHRRQVSRTNIADIMGVPLFIKAPYQQKGVISDRHVQLIDVMPTMLDMLDIPDPWRMDGTSAIGDAFEKRSQLKLFDGNTIHIVEPAAIDHSDTLKWKFKLFDSGKLPDALFRFGPRKELIGREVDKIGVAGSTSMIVSLDDTDLFSDVDLKSDFIPARISGTIPKLDRPQEPYLAIAINGTVRALTRPTEPRGRFRKFSAMVPETAFRQGRNHVEAFLVSTETTGKAALWRAEGQQFPPPWLKKLGRTETRKGPALSL